MPQFLNSISPLPSSYHGRLASGNSIDFSVLFITPWNGQHRKHSSSIVACIRSSRNLFPQLVYSNGCTRHISFHDNSSTVACGHYLAIAVSLAPQFLLWANTTYYYINRLAIRIISISKTNSIRILNFLLERNTWYPGAELHRTRYMQQMWRLRRKTNPSSPLLPLSSPRRRDLVAKHTNGLGTNKNLVMAPDGTENKIYSAGEDHQQFRGPEPGKSTV
jgi:hypothetical protein